MSPTIPPVLVLSLLLLPLAAASEEAIDLVALIRETLKYWRRIYKMYQEEVALGYCWAEHFLHLGETVWNTPMSRSAFLSPTNFEFGKKKDVEESWSPFTSLNPINFGVEMNENTRENFYRSIHGKERVRLERSYGIFNSTEKYETGTVSGKMVMKRNELLERTSTATNTNHRNPYDFTSTENKDLGFNRFRGETNHKFSNFYVANYSCFNQFAKEIPKSPKKHAASDDKKNFPARRFRAPCARSKAGSSFKSVNREEKTPRLPAVDVNHSSVLTSLTSSRGIRAISKKEIQRKNSASNRCRKSKTKYDLKLTTPGGRGSRTSRVFMKQDGGGGSSFSFAFSQIGFNNDSLPSPKGAEIVETPLALEFKGSRAEGDRELNRKLKGPEVDTRRKVLRPGKDRGASGSSTSNAFSRWGGQESLLPPRRVLFVGDSRFKGRNTMKKFNDKKGREDFRRGRAFDESNPEFRRAGRAWMLVGTLRKNSRRKRNTKNRIRNPFVEPPSRNKKSFYTPLTSGRFPGSFLSSKKKALNAGVWKNRNNKGTHFWGENGNWKLRDSIGKLSTTTDNNMNQVSTNSNTAFSKYSTRILNNNKYRLFRSGDTEMSPVNLKRIYLFSSFIDSTRLGPSINHLFLKGSIKKERNEGENNWVLGSNFKQLLTPTDNRYQIGTGEEERETIKYPLRRPLLLPFTYQGFMGDYGRPTSGISRNSIPSRLSRAKDQGQRSSNAVVKARGLSTMMMTVFDFHLAFMAVLKVMKFFIRVGRETINYVESNMALSCTKDYLVDKAIQWIDS
ncbi:uncharacterized protein LOC116431150 [Nomia melanderi]|uniref:uncharacterized protein LOC116431150 n=1 Tax=Nomia melanderi TaxID=2448451 RepID=UPI0013040F38|nr:uncharacterized protein LOC116431150 [Nomia melanderi]